VTAARAAAAVGLVVALGAVSPARAYVREVTEQPPYLPVYWTSPCVVTTIYLNGFTEMTSDEVAKSIAGAAQAWSPDTVTCPGPGSDAGAGHPSFEIITQLSTSATVPPLDGGTDGKNSIIFRTTDWILDKPEAIALTSRNTDASGRIFDADIEINAVPVSVDPFRDFQWANLDPGAPAPVHGDQIDLQTAITHEFGHFLGLAHTCFADGDAMRLLDDQGQPQPDCVDGAAIPQAAAVMWYEVDRNNALKRAITADDARGLCAIYPASATPAVCAVNVPDDGCGCRTGGTRPGAAGALLLALGALATARRQRR
jgi:MYXO-CTERM domain-containing protein